jgi:MFS family permease
MTAPGPPLSAWAPLRRPLYRALFIAQFVSNIGTWIQTVGAQWLMGSLGGSALEVSLVQAATLLPGFVVALPAGALGDIVDRRRLLLATQTVMLVAAAALAVAGFAGVVTPVSLLALVFTVGLGTGLTTPTWQAIIPELVDRDSIPQAAALGGVNHNLTRAIGPAIGGAVVAAAGPEWTFALNAISFVGVLAVIARWHRPPAERPLGPEHILAAIRSGLAYARHAPALRAVFARAMLFAVFAGALWALLPVLTRSVLGLGPAGYGLLLGVVGVGAVVGAVVLPRTRAAFSSDQIVFAAYAAFGAACGLCALVPRTWAVALAQLLAGASWIAATSTLNGTAIEILPAWVRSRGLSLYTAIFQGGQALSAIAFGAVAQAAGVRVALGAVAAGLLAGAGGHRLWRLPATTQLDIRPHPWPVEPALHVDPDRAAGPVLVTVDYRVPPEHREAFLERMRELGRVRRRTGAERWGLFTDGSDPTCFVETFLVPTWEEHLRQHGERATTDDRFVEREVSSLAAHPRQVRHLIFAYED